MKKEESDQIKPSLPKGLTLNKEGYWRGSLRFKGKRYNKNFGSSSKVQLDEAKYKFYLFKDCVYTYESADISILHKENIDSNDIDMIPNISKKSLEVIYRKAKRRASLKGMEFTLSLSELFYMASVSSNKCAITGIEFTDENINNSRVRPFVPSLDRVDSDLGYTKENCRLICASVNLALMDFGDAVFDRLASAYIAKKLLTKT